MARFPALISRLRDHGFRVTPQREIILAEIMASTGHITPRTLARRVRRKMPAINESTVYRTLAVLEEVGVVKHSHQERGAEYHLSGEGDHVHMTCSKCGAEDDLSMAEADSLRRLIQRHRGFVPDLTHFAISGLCSRCGRGGTALRRPRTRSVSAGAGPSRR